MALLGYHAVSALGGYAVLRAERGEPSPFDSRAAALMIRETSARALTTLLRPLGWGTQAPRVSLWGQRTPVVLVPGIRRNRGSLHFLQTFLTQRGFGVHSVNHRRPERGLADLASDLATEVEAVCKAAGAEKIDLVGHSYGGLVAAWYVRHLGGDQRVRRLITLGTPFGGTKMAVFGRGRASVELLPASPLLKALTPLPVPTICVWSPDDPVIVPSRAAVADGAESVRIEASGHVDMLFSSRVFRAVQTSLSDEPAVVAR
ncbi:MAG: alpha/beta fold hydrolase [Deltaproteobacteria bacterium]|nr:MAG: alpha/beta fold hydrolase [Deltaproteobacteria bacterium]